MIIVQDILVSDDLLKEHFVCDLSACKGACCVEGDAGAPLTEEETKILEQIFELVKPFLRPEGVAAIEAQGTHILDWEQEAVTPLRDGKECAYTVFENGVAACGIERAYQAGAVSFRKPLSCHLYPVRLRKGRSFVAANYDQWQICKAACSLGEQLKVPVFRFVKDALIRSFGQAWYTELETVYEEMKKQGIIAS